MLTEERNEPIYRVEGNAPIGQLMRQHWIPAGLSEEVTERDGTPVKIRPPGENLDTPDTEIWRKLLDAQVGVDLNDDYTMRRMSNNHFLQDCQTRKVDNFTGIRSVPNQDIAKWMTMRLTAGRERDILDANDVAIIEFPCKWCLPRNNSIPMPQRSAPPRCAFPSGVCSYQRILLENADRRTIEAA